MWHLLTYSWIIAAGLFILIAGYNRRINGIIPALISTGMQIAAPILYWHEWHRLEGTPDRLYVWIVPLVLIGVSLPILMAGIFLNIVSAAPKRL